MKRIFSFILLFPFALNAMQKSNAQSRLVPKLLVSLIVERQGPNHQHMKPLQLMSSTASYPIPQYMEIYYLANKKTNFKACDPEQPSIITIDNNTKSITVSWGLRLPNHGTVIASSDRIGFNDSLLKKLPSHCRLKITSTITN